MSLPTVVALSRKWFLPRNYRLPVSILNQLLCLALEVADESPEFTLL